jgi:hypothetical protein
MKVGCYVRESSNKRNGLAMRCWEEFSSNVIMLMRIERVPYVLIFDGLRFLHMRRDVKIDSHSKITLTL